MKNGKTVKNLFYFSNVLALFLGGLFCVSLFTQCTDADSTGMGQAVDTQAPKLSITYPPSDCSSIMEDFILAGNSSDDRGIKSLTLEIKGTSSNVKDFNKSYDISVQDNWSIHLNQLDENGKRELKDGTYEFTITAKDDVPHVVTDKKTITIDNTPPVLILTSPESFGPEGLSSMGQQIQLEGELSERTDNKIALMQVNVFDYNTKAQVDQIEYKDVVMSIKSPYPIARYFSAAVADEGVLGEDDKVLFNNYKRLMQLETLPSVKQAQQEGKEKYTRQVYLSLGLYDGARCYKTIGDFGTGRGNYTSKYYLRSSSAFIDDSDLSAGTIQEMFENGYKDDAAHEGDTHAATLKGSASIEIDEGAKTITQEQAAKLPSFKFCFANSPTYSISKWALGFKPEDGSVLDTGEYTNHVYGSAANSVYVIIDSSLDKSQVLYTNKESPEDNVCIYLKKARINDQELKGKDTKASVVRFLEDKFKSQDATKLEDTVKFLKDDIQGKEHTGLKNSAEKGQEYKYVFATTNLEPGFYYKVYMTGKDAQGNDIEAEDYYYVYGKSDSEKPVWKFQDNPTLEGNVTLSNTNPKEGTTVPVSSLTNTLKYTGLLTISAPDLMYEDDKGGHVDPVWLSINRTDINDLDAYNKYQGSFDKNTMTGTYTFTNPQNSKDVINATLKLQKGTNERTKVWTLTLGGTVPTETNTTYTFTLWAKDNLNQDGPANDRSITIDNKKPVIDGTRTNGKLITKETQSTQTPYVDAEDLDQQGFYHFEGLWSDEDGTGTQKILYAIGTATGSPASAPTPPDASVTGVAGWQEVEGVRSTTGENSWVCKIAKDTLKGEGKYIWFRAVDKGGLLSDVLAYENVTFDYTKPQITKDSTISLDTWYNAATNAGQAVIAKITITDDVRLQNAQVKVIDNSTGQEALSGFTVTEDTGSTDVSKTFTVTKATNAPDGNYTITATAKDCVDHTGNMQSLPFGVDSTVPTLNNTKLGSFTASDLAQNNTNWLNETTLKLQGDFAESGSGIEALFYKLSNSKATPASFSEVYPEAKDVANNIISTLISNFNVQGYNANIAGSSSNTLEFYIKDVAGNESTHQTFYVNIDKTPPTLTVSGGSSTGKLLVNPNAVSFSQKDFTGTWGDDASGLKEIKLTSGIKDATTGKDKLDSVAVTIVQAGQTWSSSLTAADLNNLGLASGAVDVSAVAIDYAGNTSGVQKLFTLEIDGNAPQVATLSVTPQVEANGKQNNVNGTITVSGDVTDGEGNLKEIQISLWQGSPQTQIGATKTISVTASSAKYSEHFDTTDTLFSDSQDLVIKVKAIDLADNSSERQKSVFVDQSTDKPRVSPLNFTETSYKTQLGALTGSNVFSSLDAKLTFNVNDDDGIQAITATLTNTAIGSTAQTLPVSFKMGGTSSTINASLPNGITSGEYTLVIEIQDTEYSKATGTSAATIQNNRKCTDTRVIAIDTGIPALSITGNENDINYINGVTSGVQGAKTSVPLAIDASDDWLLKSFEMQVYNATVTGGAWAKGAVVSGAKKSFVTNGGNKTFNNGGVSYDFSGDATCLDSGATDLSDGNYILEFSAVDALDNKKTVTRKVCIDKTAPTFGTNTNAPHITTAIGTTVGSTPWYNTNILDIAGTVTDTLSGLKSVSYQVAGNTTTATANLTNESYAAQVAGLKSDDVITLTVQDNAGNTNTANVPTFKIDTDKPKMTGSLEIHNNDATGPAQTSPVLSNGSIPLYIKGSTSDAKGGSGVKEVKISVGDKTFATSTLTATLEAQTTDSEDNLITGFSVIIPNSNLTAKGDVYVKITDNVGLETTDTIFNLDLDTKVPTVSINSVSPVVKLNNKDNVNGTITVQCLPKDENLSGVTFFASSSDFSGATSSSGTLSALPNAGVIRQAGATSDEITSAPYSVQIDTTDTTKYSEDSNIYIMAVARDRAGNLGYTKVTYYVDQDTDVPVVTPDTFGKNPLASDVLSPGETMTFKLKDDDGIENVIIQTALVTGGVTGTYTATELGNEYFTKGSKDPTINYKIPDNLLGEYKIKIYVADNTRTGITAGSVPTSTTGNDVHREVNTQEYSIKVDGKVPELKDSDGTYSHTEAQEYISANGENAKITYALSATDDWGIDTLKLSVANKTDPNTVVATKTFQATAQTGGKYGYIANFDFTGTGLADSSGSGSATSLADGEYILTFEATDFALKTTRIVRNVFIDKTEPVFSSEPSITEAGGVTLGTGAGAKTWYKNNSLAVGAQITESGSGLSSINYNVYRGKNADNTRHLQFSAGLSSTSNTLNFVVNSLETGDEIEVTVTDKAGNKGVSSALSGIYIDMTPPKQLAVSVTDPTDATRTLSSPFLTNGQNDFVVTGAASDAKGGSEIKSIQLLQASDDFVQKAGEVVTATLGGKTTESDGSLKVSWSATLQAGTNKDQIKGGDVYVRIIDNAGNEYKGQVFNIILDKTPPVTSISSILPTVDTKASGATTATKNVNGTITVNVDAKDQENNLLNVKLEAFSGTSTTAVYTNTQTTAPFIFSIDTTQTGINDNTAFEIKVTAIDKAANTTVVSTKDTGSVYNSLTVNQSTDRPVISATTLEAGTSYSPGDILTFKLSDDDGIKSVKLTATPDTQNHTTGADVTETFSNDYSAGTTGCTLNYTIPATGLLGQYKIKMEVEDTTIDDTTEATIKAYRKSATTEYTVKIDKDSPKFGADGHTQGTLDYVSQNGENKSQSYALSVTDDWGLSALVLSVANKASPDTVVAKKTFAPVIDATTNKYGFSGSYVFSGVGSDATTGTTIKGFDETSTTLADGEYILTFEAKDFALKTTRIVRNVFIDKTAPTFSTSPAIQAQDSEKTVIEGKTWYQKNNLKVAGQVATSAVGSGIAGISYKVLRPNASAGGGYDIGEPMGLSSLDRDFSFTASALKTGDVIVVTVKDKAGNTSNDALATSRVTGIHIDTDSPQLPENSIHVYNSDAAGTKGAEQTEFPVLSNATIPLYVEGQAYDNPLGTGVNTIKLKLGDKDFTNNAIDVPSSNIKDATDASGATIAGTKQWHVVIPANKITTAGEVYVQILDKVNKTTIAQTFKLNLDTTAPTVTLGTPAPLCSIPASAGNAGHAKVLNGTITLDCSPKDDQNLGGVTFFASNTDFGSVTSMPTAGALTPVGATNSEITSAPYSIQIDTTQYTDEADLYILAVARDKAGNLGFAKETYYVAQSTDTPVVATSNFEVGSFIDVSGNSTGKNKFGTKVNNKLIFSVTDDDGIQDIRISTAGTGGSFTSLVTRDSGTATSDYFSVGSTNAQISYPLPAVCGSYDIAIQVIDTTYNESTVNANATVKALRQKEVAGFKVAVDDSSPSVSFVGGAALAYVPADNSSVNYTLKVTEDWGLSSLVLKVFKKDDNVATATPQVTYSLPLTSGVFGTAGQGSFAFSKDTSLGTDSLTDGTYKLRFVPKDLAGNEGSAIETQVIIDTTAPEFGKKEDSSNVGTALAGNNPQITSTGSTINGKAWYSNETLSLKGDIFESSTQGSGLSTVTYTIEHSDTTLTSTTGDLPAAGSFSTSISGFVTGDKIKFRATDMAGNSSEYAILSVIYIDKTGPQLEAMGQDSDGQDYFVEVTANGTTQTSPVLSNGTADLTVTFKVKDTSAGGVGSGVKQAALSVGNSDFSDTTLVATSGKDGSTDVTFGDATAESTASYTCSFVIPQAKIANGSVYYRIEDNAGSKTENNLFSIKLDKKSPEAKINVPRTSSIVNNKVEITGTGSDNETLDSVKLYISKKLTAQTDNPPSRLWDATTGDLLANGDTDGNPATPDATGQDWTLIKIYDNKDAAAWSMSKQVSATTTLDNRFDVAGLEDGWYYLMAVAKDAAGNANIGIDKTGATQKEIPPSIEKQNLSLVQVSLYSDRPVIKVTNIAQNAGMLKYGTNAQITGNITDDDATGTAVVKEFIASSLPLTLDANGALQIKDNSSYSITTDATGKTVIKNGTDNVGGTTLFNQATGEWTFEPEDIEDGLKTVYFYIKDTEGGVFMTGMSPDAKHAATASGGDGLVDCRKPYIQFKAEADKSSCDAVVTYTSDSKSPDVKQGLMQMTSTFDIANSKWQTETPSISTGTVAGGKTSNNVRFIFVAQDNNGIKDLEISVKGKKTTKAATPATKEITQYMYIKRKTPTAGAWTNQDGYEYATSPAFSALKSTADATNTKQSGDASVIVSAGQEGKNDKTVVTWTTEAFDFSDFDTGTIEVSITAFDTSELQAGGSYSFLLDNTGPKVTVTSPSSRDELTSSVTLTGTCTDEGGSKEAVIYCIVPKYEHRSKTAQSDWQDAQGNITMTGYGVDYGFMNTNTQGSASFWKFPFDSKTNPLFDKYTSEDTTGVYSKTADVEDGVYTVPVYFWAEDRLGNVAVSTDFSLRYNPDADRPKTDLSYPTATDYDKYKLGESTAHLEGESKGYITLAGSVRMTGSSVIPSGTTTVHKSYFQIAQAGADGTVNINNFASSAALSSSKTTIGSYTATTTPAFPQDVSIQGALPSDWWGVELETKNGNWSETLNSIVNSVSHTIASGTYVQIRACATNALGKLGAWSSPIVIKIDENAPEALAQLVQYTTPPTTSSTNPETNLKASRDYLADMYIRGQWYLAVQLFGTNGIKDGTVAVKKGSTDLPQSAFVVAGNGSNITGSALKFSDSTDTNLSNKKGLYVYIPTDANDTRVTYTITAESNVASNAPSISRTFTLNIDNKAPTLEDVLRDGNSNQLEGGVLRNSDFVTTFGTRASDEGSGFAFTALYFTRNRTQGGDTPDTVELPLLEKKATGFAPYSAANVASNTQFATSGLTHDVPDNAGASPTGLATGLWGKEATVTRAAKNKVSIPSGCPYITEGGAVIIGGQAYIIDSIQGSVATISGDVSLAITSAFFPCAIIINNTGEAPAWNKGSLVIKDDDGDGIIETVKPSGTVYKWTTSLYTATLDDGPVTLESATFDVAGNVTTSATSPSAKAKVKLANKTPRLSKVWVATDLNGDGKFEDSELGTSYVTKVDGSIDANAKYYSCLNNFNVQDVVTIDKLGSVDARSADSGVRLTGDGIVSLEFVNFDATDDTSAGKAQEGFGSGQGEVRYSIMASKTVPTKNTATSGDTAVATSVLSLTNTTSDYFEDATGATNRRGETTATLKSKPYIKLQEADIKKLSSGYTECTQDNKALSYLSLTLWDSPIGATLDATGKRDASSSQWTMLNIPLQIDLDDDVTPEAAIKPLYWKGMRETEPLVLGESKNNSLYYNDTVNGTTGAITAGPAMGHIEIADDYDATAGKPAASGVIKIEGVAYDDQRLQSIKFSIGSITDVSISYTPSTNTWGNVGTLATDGYNFSVEDFAFTQQGNTVFWKLLLDTAKLGNGDKTLTITSTQAKVATNKDSATATVQTGKGSAPAKTGLAKEYATCTSKYILDIRPYITSVERADTEGGDYEIGVERRTKLGSYPVREGEQLVVKGFNFGTTPSVKVANTTATLQENKTNSNSTTYASFTMTVPGNSGLLSVTNGTVSLNNTNDNNAKGDYPAGDNSRFEARQNFYNREVNTQDEALSLHYTDDRYLYVWNLGNYFKGTDGVDLQNPVMAADTNGNLYASWVAQANSNVKFSHGVSKNNGAIFRCYDQPATQTGLAVDTKSSDANNRGASVAFIPEQQGSGGTFSRNGMASNTIVGGSAAINLPKDFITGNYDYGGQVIQIRGNPRLQMDNDNYTAYYSLASYDMNRRLGSFVNPKAARFGNYLHNIWYDKITKGLKYSLIDVSTDLNKFTGFSGDTGIANSDTTSNGGSNGNAAAFAGWVVIDGGITGQDRLHSWTAINNNDAPNSSILQSSGRYHTFVQKKTGGTVNSGAKFTSDLFASKDDQINSHTSLESSTQTSVVLWSNSSYIPQVGDTIALMASTAGKYNISLRTITGSGAVDGSGNAVLMHYSDGHTYLGWDASEPVTHNIDSVAVYGGNMNVVKTTNNSSQTSVFSDYTTSATGNSANAGTYADIDVSKDGYPIIAYNDATSSKLRVAYATKVAPTLASDWTRVTTDIKCTGDVCVRSIEGNVYITFAGANKKPCFITCGITNMQNELKPENVEVIDEVGTLSYSQLSLQKVGGDYVPCVAYLNEAGSRDSVKYAQKRKIGTQYVWDVQILPSVADAGWSAADDENQVCVAGNTGWNDTPVIANATGVQGVGVVAGVTPSSVQAAVAFKSDRYSLSYLKKE